MSSQSSFVSSLIDDAKKFFLGDDYFAKAKNTEKNVGTIVTSQCYGNKVSK